MVEKHQLVQLLALVQLLNPKCNSHNSMEFRGKNNCWDYSTIGFGILWNSVNYFELFSELQ